MFHEPHPLFSPWFPRISVLLQQPTQLCSLFHLSKVSILNTPISTDSADELTMMVGTCSPGATAQTSLNISDNLGFGNFSALVNALITSALVFFIKAASSDSDHQPLEAKNALNRCIGLSTHQPRYLHDTEDEGSRTDQRHSTLVPPR